MENVAMSLEQQRPASQRRRPYTPPRPQGLFALISMVIFQPGAFFQTLPPMSRNRQWVWVAILVLTLSGYVAVRQQELSQLSSPGDNNTGIPSDSFGGDLGGNFDGGPLLPDGGFGGPPVDGVGGAPTTGTPPDITTTWSTAILLGSGITLQWFALAGFLSLVSIFSRRWPSFGRNMQIVIWSSLPLAFMAILQLLFFGAGGKIGEPGITGIIIEQEFFMTLTPILQAVVISLSGRLTIFWLWSLALTYFGARYALHGQRWAILLVLMVWVVTLTVVPTVIDYRQDVKGGEDAPIDQDGSNFESEIPPVDGFFEDTTHIESTAEETIPESSEGLPPVKPAGGIRGG